ncbi:head-tail joining protein [Enterobacter ludwigii]
MLGPAWILTMSFNSLMKSADQLLIATFGNDGGVTLWPDRDDFRVIEAIVDKPYERTDIPDGGHITGADRSFTASDYDVAGLQRKEAVLVEGETLYVKELQPDGLGVTRVLLVRHQKTPAVRSDGGRL